MYSIYEVWRRKNADSAEDNHGEKNNHDAISSAEQRSTVDSRRCLTT